MKKFLKCFVYAFRGIVFCLANERNMRVHLCFTVYMFGYLTVYDFFEVSRTGFAVLFTLCALVKSLEAVLTASRLITRAHSVNSTAKPVRLTSKKS